MNKITPEQAMKQGYDYFGFDGDEIAHDWDDLDDVVNEHRYENGGKFPELNAYKPREKSFYYNPTGLAIRVLNELSDAGTFEEVHEDIYGPLRDLILSHQDKVEALILEIVAECDKQYPQLEPGPELDVSSVEYDGDPWEVEEDGQ